MSEIENLKIGNGGTLHIVGNEDIIANEWEAGQVYIENRSYVIREHKLLMCNTTHTSVEPFDPDKWTEKNIGEALGTAGSANMIECTLAEYTAWKAGGQLINETVYVITDAPNLNATAKQISYEGGADTVWDKVESKAAAKWTMLGNYLGSDSADITSVFATANELKITARTYTSGQIGSSQLYTIIVCTNEITDFLAGGFTELHYLEGMNNGQSNVIDFVINSTTIRIATFLLNGNDVKSNSNTGFKVYYR